MRKAQIAVGHSPAMRTAQYEAKVRAAMNDGPLSRQEREWCQHHADKGSDPVKVAIAFMDVRRIERRKRAMAEAMELETRFGAEL